MAKAMLTPETDINSCLCEIDSLVEMLRREVEVPNNEEQFPFVLGAALARIQALTNEIAHEVGRQEEEEEEAERLAALKTKSGAVGASVRGSSH